MNMKILINSFFVFMFATCFAHPREDELKVAEALVHMIMSTPEWDDNLSMDSNTEELELSYQTYEDLFSVEFPSNAVGNTWSPQERKTAFEDFISMIPELSTNGAYRAIRLHAGVSLSYCCEHGASNTLQAALRILQCPDSYAREEALSCFERLAEPSEEINLVAERILTNKIEKTELDRMYFLGAYANVLKNHKNDCPYEYLTNGVSIVKAGVFGWAGSIALDKLLLAVYPEYVMSSNRLAVAKAAIESNYPNMNWWNHGSVIKNYFIPITNQLINAAQPLPEVEMLREL